MSPPSPLLLGEADVERLQEYVLCWRFWKVSKDETGLCLRSLVVNVDWPKYALLTADCRHRETNHDQMCADAGDHQAPLYQGECGIYGYRTAAEALQTSLSETYMNGRIIGKVALGGDGIDHDLGYRAYCAYPQRLVAAGCAKTGHLIPLSVAKLAFRDGGMEGKKDSTFTIYCEEHLPSQAADFDWVKLLASQYGITVGEYSEFVTT